MKYEGFRTFATEHAEGILTVTFNFGSVNVQGQEMLEDFNSLAMRAMLSPFRSGFDRSAV